MFTIKKTLEQDGRIKYYLDPIYVDSTEKQEFEQAPNVAYKAFEATLGKLFHLPQGTLYEVIDATTGKTVYKGKA